MMGELRAAGTLFLSLTGGEVLSSPHLFPVLDRARELNLAVQMLSNGTLLRPGVAARLGELPQPARRQHQRLRRDAGGARRHHADPRLLAADARRRRAAARPGGRRAPQADRHAPQRARGGGDAGALRRAGVPLPASTSPSRRATTARRGSLAMRITEDELAALYRGPLQRPHPQRQPRRRRGGLPLQLRARQLRHLGARRRLPLRLGPLGGRQRPRAAVRRDLARLAGVRADPRAQDRRLPGLRPLPRQVLLLARSRRRLQRLGQLHRDRPVRLRRRRRRARRRRGARTAPAPDVELPLAVAARADPFLSADRRQIYRR